MDPITGAAALGSIMSFKGQRAAAKSAAQAAEYNAQVAENEAVLLQRKKLDEEKNVRNSAQRLIASQNVATAVSGIEMSGSPLQAIADSYYALERDVVNIRYASDIEQIQKQSEARLTRVQGQARKAAVNTQAYASLLGDVTSTYSIYKDIG